MRVGQRMVVGAALVSFALLPVLMKAQKPFPMYESLASSINTKAPNEPLAASWPTQSAGTLKIFLEKQIVDSTGRHTVLADSLASIFRKARNPSELMERTILAIKGIYRKFGENGFSGFSEAVKTGDYDCENLSVLIFDAYKKAGFEPQFVLFSMHVGIKVGNFIIEPSWRKWYPISSCDKKIYLITPDPKIAVQIFVLFNQADEAASSEKYAEAIGKLRKAAEIAPENPDVYLLLARIYYKLGDYTQGSEELRRYSKIVSRTPCNGVAL